MHVSPPKAVVAPDDRVRVGEGGSPFKPGRVRGASRLYGGAPKGQQRSLRRIRQFLSCAFARSPGARSLACPRFACFCDSGLFFPRYGILAYVLPR
jgi:hypothetical protein